MVIPLGMAEWCIPFWVTLLWHWLLASFLGFSCYITAIFPQMCLMLDQFLWGHSSRVCDISCFLRNFTSAIFHFVGTVAFSQDFWNTLCIALISSSPACLSNSVNTLSGPGDLLFFNCWSTENRSFTCRGVEIVNFSSCPGTSKWPKEEISFIPFRKNKLGFKPFCA